MNRDEWAKVGYTTHESRCPGGPRRDSTGHPREWLCEERGILRLRSKFRQGGWEIWGPFKGQMSQALYFRHSEAKTNVNGWQEGKKIDVTLG